MASYYHSKHWQSLRAIALKRDGGRCVTPGCGQPATHVDHHIARPKGATEPTHADVLGNLRSMCKPCHSQKTAMSDGGYGNRKGAARRVVVKGCDSSGQPLDPGHHWTSPGSRTP